MGQIVTLAQLTIEGTSRSVIMSQVPFPSGDHRLQKEATPIATQRY